MRFLPLPIIFILFLSCGKSGDSPSDNSAALSYKVHDSMFSVPDNGSNIYLYKTSATGVTQYSFLGSYQNSKSQSEGLTFIAMTDSLQEGTYVFDHAYYQTSSREFSEIAILHNGIPYLPPADVNGGSFTLTISKYSGGEINGTFSGTLVSVSGDMLNVSEGQFKNVKAIY